MSKKKNVVNRAALFGSFFMLLFLILIGRFLYLEIGKTVQGHSLEALASERWGKTKALPASRGTIYDRSGNTLVQDIPAYTIYAVVDPNYPKHIKDPEKAARQLAPILDMKASEIEKLLSQKGKFQVEFGAKGRQLSLEKKAQIDALKIEGIEFKRETKRLYRNKDFASHVIGYASTDEGKEQMHGVMGIEKSFDKPLTGTDGLLKYQGDIRRTKIPDTKEVIKRPENGDKIYLTIDSNIQTTLEQSMTSVEKQFNPERIIGIALNPKTGEVLALSNRPSFDPNLRNITNYTDFSVSSRFEPGSTMKMFTLASAIQEGVYNGNEYYMSGKYKVEGGTIKDHNGGQGWGSITFNEGVQRSSNVGFSILAKEKLGLDRYFQYLHKFDFDKKTGIDLPNEINSSLRSDYEIEKVTTAFGQGSAVTAMQLVKAATAIANDGKMMKPYVVQKVVNEETGEVIKDNKPSVAGQPISKETAKQTRDILETVVTGEHGTGKMYNLEGIPVAGKTGTAQIAKEDGHGYMTGRGNYIYSFLGMAPKDDPQLIVYVAVDRPKLSGAETGEMAVSTIFNEVMKNGLKYLEVDETKEAAKSNNIQKIALPSLEGLSTEEAKQKLQNLGVQPVVLGRGKTVQGQKPSAHAEVLAGERVLIKTDDVIPMPDMTNWSLRDVIKFADLLQIEPDIAGSGYVVKQNITPQKPVKKGDYLQVELKEPN